MNKYINYKRISGLYNTQTLEDKFKEIIENGWEIIHYDETIKDDDKFRITIICGIPNKGSKKMLL